MIPHPRDFFKTAILTGMAVSPFTTSDEHPLVMLVGGSRQELVGCLIKTEHVTEAYEATGVHPGYYLDAHIPKDALPAKPRVTVDALEYLGRKYSLSNVSGDDEISPVWVVRGNSPLKS
jgi:hypothetical protein